MSDRKDITILSKIDEFRSLKTVRNMEENMRKRPRCKNRDLVVIRCKKSAI